MSWRALAWGIPSGVMAAMMPRWVTGVRPSAPVTVMRRYGKPNLIPLTKPPGPLIPTNGKLVPTPVEALPAPAPEAPPAP